MHIYEKETFHSCQWSGGVTTELYLAPETASYEKRDFDIRISTATVDAEESVFTVFPHMDRLLMVIKGSIELSHDGSPAIHLGVFKPHEFSGEAHTRSVGKCQDFNVIVRRGVYAFAGTKIVWDQPADIPAVLGKVLFYAMKGCYEIGDSEGIQTIREGGLAVAAGSGTGFHIQPKEPGGLICILVSEKSH